MSFFLNQLVILVFDQGTILVLNYYRTHVEYWVLKFFDLIYLLKILLYLLFLTRFLYVFLDYSLLV